MTGDYVYISTPKNHYDFYCPMCGKKSYGLDDPQPCEHVMYTEIGGHIGYIRPDLEQQFDEIMAKFEEKRKKGEEVIEPEMDDFLAQLDDDDLLSITYSEQTSVPFACLDVHILYKICN